MSLLALAVVIISAILLLGLSLLRDRVKASFRKIPAFTTFNRYLGTAVEDGSRLHIALGNVGVENARTATSFVSLSALRRAVELSAASDKPPVVSSGDASLAILSQDNLHAAYRIAGAEHQYKATSGQLAGITPFSYVAGAMPTIADQDISANLISGGFGVEVGLLADAAERKNSFTFAATDSLPAQAVLYASAREALIGEELFASGAYLHAGRSHIASLYVQDVLRWLLILVLLGGAATKLLGGIF